MVTWNQVRDAHWGAVGCYQPRAIKNFSCLGLDFGLFLDRSWLYPVSYYLPIVYCIHRIPDVGVMLSLLDPDM